MSKKIFILSGAGLSQESGIKTFRDNNGLWENHRVEDVATPEAFVRDPKLVYRFYNLRREQLYNEVKPNPAHFAIADLEEMMGEDLFICTQNVDNLLDQAGCERVFHMHGELAKMRCIKTGQVFDAPESFDATDECECCGELANLRPHIVWFGEIPFYMDEIEKALSDCDIFISVGTSNNVYPAAGFVQVAKSLGAKCIEVNYEPTQLSSVFDENHYGKAGDRLGEVLKNFTGLF